MGGAPRGKPILVSSSLSPLIPSFSLPVYIFIPNNFFETSLSLSLGFRELNELIRLREFVV